MQKNYRYPELSALSPAVESFHAFWYRLMLLWILLVGAISTYGQVGPNCTHINASIGADDTARILVGELVTNALQIQAQGDSLTIEILGSYGQRILYMENVGPGYEISLYACPYIGRQLKVNASITGGTGGTCWSYLTFKQGNGPVIVGRSKTVYCFDPLVKGGHIHDVPPQALVPCRGSEDATFVADWVTPYDCDPTMLGMAANDTAKVILREYEAYDKNGVRGAGYDTIYVLRLPQITVDNAFCTDRDTVYCGVGGKLGPYMIAGYGFDYGAMPPPQVIDRYQAISFVEAKFNPVTRQLEFYPAEFDPKCGVSVHVDAWPLGGGECSQQYKVNVEIKQTCYGTPGLYTGAGMALTDVATFVETYHPKHWEYTRSSTLGQIDAMGTNLGTVDVFDGIFHRPSPLLKQIDAAGATSYTIYNGNGALESKVKDNDYARMCVNVPTEGTLTFTVNNTLTSYAGYELNGEYVALATGAYSLDLEPCDRFCFVSYGGVLNVTAFAWTETVMPAPLEMISDGYWRCEFWVIDLDTLPPVIDCDLDAKADPQLVHEDTLYIPAGTHECAAHAYLPPAYVVDDWSGVKFVKAIVPGIATVVFERSATVKDLFESHKQVKIPHGGAIPVYYEAYDSCHNIAYDTCWVKVKDYTKPVAICDKGVTVGLSSKKVWVDASTFDEGSWDNCGVNLLLARRADWYESCIDLCSDYVWCCTNEHYDTLYCSKLETDKHIDPVEAHYAQYLDWLCNDYVDCGPIIYNAWQYALAKYATLECIDHPYEVDEHYFKHLFEKCYGEYRTQYGHSRASNYTGGDPGSGIPSSIATFNDIDNTSGVKYCFDEFKVLPGIYGSYDIAKEIDLYEQLGGGWSDAVPFDCEDACSEVTVELLVMDYWCNWSKCWTNVLVEDKTPVEVVHEVEDQIEITCAAYKDALYEVEGSEHPVSVEYIVQAAQAGDEAALANLDALFGGYEKVWRDEYGNVPPPSHAEYYDLYCICGKITKQEKVWDEHLGYIWKTLEYDSCYYRHNDYTTYYGQVVVNCGQAVQCEQKVWSTFDHCGQGYIYREWKFIPGCPPVEGHYGSGHVQDTVKRKQLIWVGSNCELQKGMFTRPGDVYVNTCGIEYDDAGNAAGVLSPEYTGYPEYLFDDDCRIVGTTYSDKVFKIVGGDEACYKIIRTWHHIDWCYLGGKPSNANYWWLDPEYAGKIISWEQKIIVVDTVPPVCTFAEELETVQAAGCAYTLDQTVIVDDSCGALLYDWELYQWKGSSKTLVDSDEGDLDGTSAQFNIRVEDLLTGSYELKVRVTDECQNESYCIDEFDIEAGKKPSAICITSLTAELTPMDLDQNGEIDTAMAVIWANEFDRSSAPACNSDDEISFRIELMDGVDDDDFAGDADSLMIGCDQVGTQQIRLWVIDENGSFDYCDVLLVVQNNMDGCPMEDTPENEGIILGNIATENGTMIEQVEVKVTGENLTASLSTGIDGAYNFDIPMGILIQVEPTKDINDINGVSTMDLILLQKHLTGMQLLPTPYRMIAADVNHDGFLNSLDLLQMRQLIIGEISEFPTNTSWRFILSNHQFLTNAPQSEAFPERFTISMDQTMMRQDFIGMKIGDLDLDGNVALKTPRNAGARQMIEIEDRVLETGEVVEIPLYLRNASDLIGLQYTLHFDASGMKVLNVLPNNELGVEQHHFGLKQIEQGIITTAFDAKDNITGELNLLVTLQVEILKPGKISDRLSVNGSVTPEIAFYEKGNPGPVALHFVDSESANIKLYQNEPNPASSMTAIRFYLPESNAAELIFYDVDGKILKRISGQYRKGINRIDLEVSDFEKRGLIYYELRTGNEKAGRKMIIH